MWKKKIIPHIKVVRRLFGNEFPQDFSQLTNNNSEPMGHKRNAYGLFL